MLLTPFNFQDKASKSSSAYEAVFGLKYHHDLPGSLEVEDLRGIKTVEEYLKVFPDSNMQRLANQFFLDGDVEDVADGEKDGTNKSEDGDKDKQIPEDDRAKDRKPQDDSITEDIDFSILDRMKKFNPTKSILPFPSSPAGTVVVASSLQLETRNTSPS